MSVYSAQTNVTASEPYFILNSGTAAAPAVNVPALTGLSSINGFRYGGSTATPAFVAGVSTMGASVSSMIITVPVGPFNYGVLLTASGGAVGTSTLTYQTNGLSSIIVQAPPGQSFTWMMVAATQ
jgi:hypothetical protein